MAVYRKPARLKAEGRIGIVAPCSPVLEPSAVARGISALKQRGYEVVLGRHVLDQDGYLAGCDADRADDLLSMLEREDIDLTMCLRGGDGGLRTAMALDRDRLLALETQPPRAFIGFSGVTAVHAALHQSPGWVTFYGPMLDGLQDATDYTWNGFDSALVKPEPFSIVPDPEDPYVETLTPGVGEGLLVGGCLQILRSLIGTPWEPDFNGNILFFEDVGQHPCEIDAGLAQLVASGRLQRCTGIVVGEHIRCEPHLGPTLGVERVLHDHLKPLGIPTVYHLPIGHGHSMATLPIGVPARLDAGRGELTILESGVA